MLFRSAIVETASGTGTRESTNRPTAVAKTAGRAAEIGAVDTGTVGVRLLTAAAVTGAAAPVTATHASTTTGTGKPTEQRKRWLGLRKCHHELGGTRPAAAVAVAAAAAKSR